MSDSTYIRERWRGRGGVLRQISYLVHDQKKQTVDKYRPDEDVGKYPCYQSLWVVHHDGTVPVDGHKSPRQRTRNHRGMDKARVRVVAEVQEREVGEVDDENHLSPNKVAVYKQHHKCKVQKVIEDEVATHSAGLVLAVEIC